MALAKLTGTPKPDSAKLIQPYLVGNGLLRIILNTEAYVTPIEIAINLMFATQPLISSPIKLSSLKERGRVNAVLTGFWLSAGVRDWRLLFP